MGAFSMHKEPSLRHRTVKMDMGKIARLIIVEYLTYIEMDIIQKFSNMKLIKR